MDARENILDHTKDLWGQKGNKSPKLSVRGIRGRKNCVELEKPKLYIPRDVARKERGRLLSSRWGRIVSSHNANKNKNSNTMASKNSNKKMYMNKYIYKIKKIKYLKIIIKNN